MIDARELRIGNWVERNDNWSYRRDETNKCFQWNESDWYSLGECTIFLEDISPIPLTTEILLKCGFEWYEPLKHWRLVDKEQWYSIREIKFDNLKEKSLVFSWTNLAWDEGQSMPYVIVKTVHQLQNLFYALHQKELEIKL